MAPWYRILTTETRAHIYAVSFEPIIRLLPERSSSAILVQSLAKRWWDTTHTFHIIDREMTVTPHDFHHMIGLRCDRALINLEGKSGTQLGIDLLGRRYNTNTIHFLTLRWITSPYTGDGRRLRPMAKAFSLYLLVAYLFANIG